MKSKFFILASLCVALTACENHERKEKKVTHERTTETRRDGAGERTTRSDFETRERNAGDRSDY